jgi:hypothetical protein
MSCIARSTLGGREMTGKEHGNGWLWPSQDRPYITLHHHGLLGDRFVDVVWPSCYFNSKGDCRLKSDGIACPWEINGESGHVVDVDVCVATRIDWDINDQFPSHWERYVVI